MNVRQVDAIIGDALHRRTHDGQHMPLIPIDHDQASQVIDAAAERRSHEPIIPQIPRDDHHRDERRQSRVFFENVLAKRGFGVVNPTQSSRIMVSVKDHEIATAPDPILATNGDHREDRGW